MQLLLAPDANELLKCQAVLSKQRAELLSAVVCDELVQYVKGDQLCTLQSG